MKTRITEILGIEHPIILGGMVYISKAPLTVAVSKAGGLGTIAAGGMAPDELEKEIDKVIGLTDKPFGVNIPLLDKAADELIKITLKKDVRVIILSAGKPDKYIQRIKEAGKKILQVIPSAYAAKKVEQAGADAVIASGYEAGGHLGHDELTTLALIPQVVDAVSIPVVAAGGIADARGFIAALALGAEGIQLGTAFAAAQESPAHIHYKRALLAADDRSTTVIGRGYGTLIRTLHNDLSNKIEEMAKKGVPPDEIRNFIQAGRTKRALVDGEIEAGTPVCGQIVGLVKEISSAQEVMDALTTGQKDVLIRLQKLAKLSSR